MVFPQLRLGHLLVCGGLKRRNGRDVVCTGEVNLVDANLEIREPSLRVVAAPFKNKQSAVWQRTESRDPASRMFIFYRSDRLSHIRPFAVRSPVVVDRLAREPRQTHNRADRIGGKVSIDLQRLFVRRPHRHAVTGDGQRLKAVVPGILLLHGGNRSRAEKIAGRWIELADERARLLRNPHVSGRRIERASLHVVAAGHYDACSDVHPVCTRGERTCLSVDLQRDWIQLLVVVVDGVV